jgi:hypothetical protein
MFESGGSLPGGNSGTSGGGSASGLGGGGASLGGSATAAGANAISEGGASSSGTAGTAGGGQGGAPAAGAGGSSGSDSLGGTAGASKGGSANGGSTANGGASGAAQAGAVATETPAGYVPGIIGVGYGGLRIVSRDAGLTWGSRASIAANGGDDDNLIRAVAYGKGRWIATGWKLWSSDDGVSWTDHGKLRDGIISDQQIVEGLAYKDGYFYAAGDGSPSRLYRSADGLSWMRYAEIGNTVKHTGLTYRGGLLVSYGDSHTSYQSSDGQHWTEMSGVEDATYCEGRWKSLDDCFSASWFDPGFYLLDEWGGTIRRSSNGQGFKNVYTDDQKNTLYRSRALAHGFVAPL